MTVPRIPAPILWALATTLLIGCQSANHPAAPSAAQTPTTTPAAPAPSQPAATPTHSAAAPPVRISAGATDPYTDSEGHAWLPDQGFADGETTDRAADLEIANTKDPKLYRKERYSMTAFSWPVPNGKYIVKLHFAETFEGITGPGQRVFSFNLLGHEFKDFDVWVKAGGAQRAYIVTVNGEVTNGKLDIGFTANVENPQINGIEILPAP